VGINTTRGVEERRWTGGGDKGERRGERDEGGGEKRQRSTGRGRQKDRKGRGEKTGAAEE